MMQTESGLADARHVLHGAFAKASKPRERLLVSEWADKHRILTSKGSAEPGLWRTSRNPILREIMDGMSLSSPVREITIMKASQVGVTEGPFIGSIGYYMHHDPCAVMVLMPTLDARDTWRVQKLNPLLTDTGVVRDLIGGIRRRDAANSKDMIDFPGGVLFLAGGNSPNSYAQKTVKVLEMDDLDRFPQEVGEEGDPVELGRTRVKAHTRYKFLKASTPTVEGASLIEREYKAGDMRKYHVQCPHCMEHQPLKWTNIFADALLTEAWYACEHCGCEIPEHMKPTLLAERGHGGTAYWKPEHPEIKDHRSYHVSTLYAPIGLGPSWLELVKLFRKIHKDHALLKVFVNSTLGETWKPNNSDVKEAELIKRAIEDNYARGTIPPGFLVFTIGVDVQDTWLEYTRLAWGPDDTNAIIEHGQIMGDTALTEVWDQLESEIHKPVVNAWGKELLPAAVAIDSRGHRTEQVKDFVMRKTFKVRVFSIQGSTTRLGRAIAQSGSSPDKNQRNKVIRHGYVVWNVGTEHCKDYIYGKLSSDGNVAVQQRSFRFPLDLPDDYYSGILAEVFDEEKKRYVQRLGAKYKRNEPLDTLVYAWAVGHHKLVRIGRDRRGNKTAQYWDRLKVMLEPGSALNPIEVEVEKADDAIEDAPKTRRLRRKKRGSFATQW